ncbi:hypothetical protein B0J17DRAFT_764040 [Rhizoctonia solani]|nr:hypothetical protein B0J17DRAFT_764040 [Rhizoctonia solani]
MDFNPQHGLHWAQDASLINTTDPTSLQGGSLIDIEVVTLQSSSPELPVHPEFAFTNGSIELQTLDCIFWVHEFQLTKFTGLANRIEEAREKATESGAGPGTRIIIPVFMKSNDFVDTLRLLYTSFVPSPELPSFDSVTFISALRIAALYDYPDLRELAIRELEEEFLLPAIRRFQLANELSLSDWESSVLSEFYNRSEPISEEEAVILGEARVMDILDYWEKHPSSQPSEDQAPQVLTNQSAKPPKTSINSDRQHCAHFFAPVCASWVVLSLIVHISYGILAGLGTGLVVVLRWIQNTKLM